MALIATQNIVLAGTKPNFTAAAVGDTAKVGPGRFVIVKNADASSHTVTVAVPGVQQNGLPNDPTVYTVAATTGEAWIPMYAYYADPVDGLAHLTYSAITSMTRAALKI